MGLRTWDKPAAACLASRVPYGTPVSVEILSRVDRAEAALHGLGFRQVRVRHYGETHGSKSSSQNLKTLFLSELSLLRQLRPPDINMSRLILKDSDLEISTSE